MSALGIYKVGISVQFIIETHGKQLRAFKSNLHLSWCFELLPKWQTNLRSVLSNIKNCQPRQLLVLQWVEEIHWWILRGVIDLPLTITVHTVALVYQENSCTSDISNSNRDFVTYFTTRRNTSWKFPHISTIWRFLCINATRLHSSRMHTSHLLTVSPSMHCMRGVPGPGGPGPGGCLVLGGVSLHALRQTPPREQNSWHMLLKILPCIIAGSNDILWLVHYRSQTKFVKVMFLYVSVILSIMVGVSRPIPRGRLGGSGRRGV